MAQQTSTSNGHKRLRKMFGRIHEVAEMPNLIEVQKQSYDQFLMVEEPEGGRLDEGLQAVFRSVFPIKDFGDRAQLEFVRYAFEPPKYDVDECQQRGMTYAAPLKVTLRLIVFDVNEETGARSVKDIKEQDVYMGDMPLMTMNGTFVINGTERVIVSQMHRSPGVFFDHDRGKTHSSGKLLFAARIIPYRGSWLDFEFDAKDIVYVRIDRRRKLPVTTLLYALGLEDEEILATFYDRIPLKATKEGWRMPFRPDRLRGIKPTSDLIDAKTGKVAIEAGRKVTARLAKKLADEGLKELLVSDEDLHGRYLAQDIVNMETGEIYGEAGEELDAKLLATLKDLGLKEIPILDIDHVNVGAFIRNTLNVDKNSNPEEALLDIYRVMRPGEPPTPEAAATLFKGIFFDFRALRPFGRGPGENEHAARSRRAGHDAHAAQRGHPRRDQDAGGLARRQGRNRRHRPSRQPSCALGRRADGESVSRRPSAHGARHQRAHELGRYRHGNAAGSDQRQARGRRGARVLRLLAAVAVHGPDQPAVGDHA